MSSKVKLKATSGGSVSMVVDDSLLTDEEFNVSTGGIESGKEGEGLYVKFPDGTLICTGYLYSGDTTEEEIAFAVPFVGDIPSITITVKSLDKQMVPDWSDIDNLTHMLVKASDLGIEANYIAIGRWK